MTEWKKRILQEFYLCTHLTICYFDRYDNMLYQFPQSDDSDFGECFQKTASAALELLSKSKKNKNDFATVCFNKHPDVYCTACYFTKNLPLLEFGRVVFGPYTYRADMAEEFHFIPYFAVEHTINLLRLYIEEYSYKNEMYETFNRAASFHFAQMVKLVEGNVNKDITLDFIAENLKLSKSYVCKIVKNTTNYTVSQFVSKEKINMAKVLFWNGFTDLHEISLILGYKSQSYFSRQFKALEGMSPSNYMKHMEEMNSEYM